MNIENSYKSLVSLFFSILVVLGLSACGGGDQTNTPVTGPSGGTESVVFESSSLQLDASQTSITGTITTKFNGTGSATLSNFESSISGCGTGTTLVGTDNTQTYSDNNSVVSNLVVTFSAPCTVTAPKLAITATQKNDDNVSRAFSATSDEITTTPIGGVTSNIVTIVPDTSSQNITLTQNNEAKTITLRVFDINNVPVESGSISVRYPSEYINGVDVGALNPISQANIVNGEATFSYVGPSDLLDLTNNGSTGTSFTFYDTSNIAKSVTVAINYAPVTTTPPPSLTDYTVALIGPNNPKPTVDLESNPVFSIQVKDDKGNLVDNSNITGSITSKHPNVVKLRTTTNTLVDSLSFSENNFQFTATTNTIAGLSDFDIALQITDAGGNVVDKNVTKAITILSGPPTAMSISYVSTGQNANESNFVETMVVFATDKYNNPVNTQPTFSTGAIAGYANDASGNGLGNNFAVRLSPVATVKDSGSGTGQLDAPDIASTTIDPFNESIAVFGDGYTYHASGKWDIASSSGTSVFFDETFTLPDVANMGYAIGHNYRQKVCEFGEESVLNVVSKDGTYKFDETGHALIEMTYDYYLMGKRVAVYVNTIGTLVSEDVETKVGEVSMHTLRGNGLDAIPGAYTIAKGSSGVNVTFSVKISNTEEYLRNSRFGISVETSGDVVVTGVTSSNSDIYDCATNGGFAFVTYTVDAPVDGGSITVKELLIADEF